MGTTWVRHIRSGSSYGAPALFCLLLVGCATKSPIVSYNYIHCVTMEDDDKGHVGLCWIDRGTEI